MEYFFSETNNDMTFWENHQFYVLNQHWGKGPRLEENKLSVAE